MPRQVAPVPKNALGPEIPTDPGYLVQEIAPGVYWINDGVYQAMFIVTDDGVVAVDAPPALGERYLHAIAGVTTEPVTHVVYTHAHYDHSGAAHLFPPDAIYIGHRDTAALLDRDARPGRPVPTMTFENSLELKVGGQRLLLDYRGVSHTPGSIYVSLPEHRVLMLVDVVFPGWVPFRNFAESKDIPALRAAHDIAVAYDFDILVAGHVGRLGTPDDVVEAAAYLDDLRDSCLRALEVVRLDDYVADLGRDNPWHLYDSYLDGIVERVTGEVVPRWVNRLGAADVFTDDNAYVMLQSLRLDR